MSDIHPSFSDGPGPTQGSKNIYSLKDLVAERFQNFMSYLKDDHSQMNVSDAHTAFWEDRQTMLGMLSAHFPQSKRRLFVALTKDLVMQARQ